MKKPSTDDTSKHSTSSQDSSSKNTSQTKTNPYTTQQKSSHRNDLARSVTDAIKATSEQRNTDAQRQMKASPTKGMTSSFLSVGRDNDYANKVKMSTPSPSVGHYNPSYSVIDSQRFILSNTYFY